jgi:hypothetical protein
MAVSGAGVADAHIYKTSTLPIVLTRIIKNPISVQKNFRVQAMFCSSVSIFISVQPALKKEFDPNSLAARQCCALLSKPALYWFYVRDVYIKKQIEAHDGAFKTWKSIWHRVAFKIRSRKKDVRSRLLPSKDMYIYPKNTSTLLFSSPGERSRSKTVYLKSPSGQHMSQNPTELFDLLFPSLRVRIFIHISVQKSPPSDLISCFYNLHIYSYTPKELEDLVCLSVASERYIWV